MRRLPSSARHAVAAVPLALLLLLGSVRGASADEESELEKARNAYLAQQYDEADARFRALFDPKSGILHDSDLIADARMYWAAVLIAKGELEEATRLFEKLLADKPEYQPDPLRVSPEVVNSFIDTRARVRDRLAQERADRVRSDAEKRLKAAERLALLERLAAQETVTTEHSRLVALLPFGVGQFQNGQTPLGYTLLGIEGALTLGSALTIPLYLYDLNQSSLSQKQGFLTTAAAFHSSAEQVRIVNLALDGALAAVAIAGIIHAEATYVPAVKDVRPRAIPSAVVFPTFAVDGSAGRRFGVGLFGSF